MRSSGTALKIKPAEELARVAAVTAANMLETAAAGVIMAAAVGAWGGDYGPGRDSMLVPKSV